MMVKILENYFVFSFYEFKNKNEVANMDPFFVLHAMLQILIVFDVSGIDNLIYLFKNPSINIFIPAA